MLRSFTAARAGRFYLAALFLLAFFQVQASATPGSYHTAMGSGVEYEMGACAPPGPFLCAGGGREFSIVHPTRPAPTGQ